MDSSILHEMFEELRTIRRRLDQHITDEDKQFREFQRDIAEIREELRGYKVKLGTMTSAISMIVAGVVAWVTRHMTA